MAVGPGPRETISHRTVAFHMFDVAFAVQPLADIVILIVDLKPVDGCHVSQVKPLPEDRREDRVSASVEKTVPSFRVGLPGSASPVPTIVITSPI